MIGQLETDKDDFGFYRYRDLVDLRIIQSRTDLHRKQQEAGFPHPVKLTKGRGAVALYPRATIKQWVKQRLEDEA